MSNLERYVIGEPREHYTVKLENLYLLKTTATFLFHFGY